MSDDHDSDAAVESLGEYTRIRANIQRGDGIDRRGDVTVEVVREYDPGRANKNRTVTLPDGMEVRTALDDQTFAQFYGELDRARLSLIDELGLDEEDG